MLWACILLPHLALDGVLRRQPDPAAPLALVGGPAQRRVIHAANAAAQALGVQRGQNLASAQAISGGVPTLDHDPGEPVRLQQLLQAWAYRYSSQVSGLYPACVLLEVRKSLGLFGPWPRFQACLREDLATLGIRHRIAVAPNPHAARVLADLHDGLMVTTPDTLARALGQVPVERARLPDQAAVALRRMGLRTLAQLHDLPRDALARRAGPGTLLQLDRLQGTRDEPIPLYRPPDRFELKIELGYEVESTQALLFPVRRLVADLAAYLAGRDGGVQQFTVWLEHEDGVPATAMPVGLLAPERDAAMLFDLARSRLDRVEVPAPVRAVRLVADDLPPFVPAARELFDPRPQQAVPWTHLRERLRARLGETAVQGLALGADHRPEHATRGDPATAARHRVPAPDTRPGWLLQRPIPLRGAPAELLSGPERIESGWWDGADVRRDYYRVLTRDGQQAWAYRAAGELGEFMLHGWFA